MRRTSCVHWPKCTVLQSWVILLNAITGLIWTLPSSGCSYDALTCWGREKEHGCVAQGARGAETCETERSAAGRLCPRTLDSGFQEVSRGQTPLQSAFPCSQPSPVGPGSGLWLWDGTAEGHCAPGTMGPKEASHSPICWHRDSRLIFRVYS